FCDGTLAMPVSATQRSPGAYCPASRATGVTRHKKVCNVHLSLDDRLRHSFAANCTLRFAQGGRSHKFHRQTLRTNRSTGEKEARTPWQAASAGTNQISRCGSAFPSSI